MIYCEYKSRTTTEPNDERTITMKNAKIFGTLNDRNNLIDFYAEDGQEKVYIFSRKYRHSLYDFFRNGISTRNLFDFTKTHRNDVVINTILQLRTHLRYIEKEYGVVIFEKRGDNKKPKFNLRNEMLWEMQEIA